MTRRRSIPLSEADAAVLSVMADWDLKPGQMLLLGPRSCAILAGETEYTPKLPDRYVIDKKDWNSEQ